MRNSRKLRCATVGLSFLFLILLAAPAFGGAVITNGAGIYLGVADNGQLGYTDGITMTQNGAGGAVGVAIQADLTAYGRGPGLYDATTPGCICEGWGVAINGTTGGGANTDTSPGPSDNISFVSFASTASTATVVTGLNGTGMQVTQAYQPSSSLALFKDYVTLTNNSSSTMTDVTYRRVMDWDIPPGEFDELVTIQGWGATSLIQTSDNGFTPSNPLDGTSEISPGCYDSNCNRTGPADHGALFDFDFGSLAAGQSVSFDIFYGAATSTVDALNALSAVGAEVYSLGQWGVGGTDGAPITYAFGFAGVGGTPIPPAGVPEPASFGLIAIGSSLLALGRRLVRR